MLSTQSSPCLPLPFNISVTVSCSRSRSSPLRCMLTICPCRPALHYHAIFFLNLKLTASMFRSVVINRFKISRYHTFYIISSPTIVFRLSMAVRLFIVWALERNQLFFFFLGKLRIEQCQSEVTLSSSCKVAVISQVVLSMRP